MIKILRGCFCEFLKYKHKIDFFPLILILRSAYPCVQCKLDIVLGLYCDENLNIFWYIGAKALLPMFTRYTLFPRFHRHAVLYETT